MNRHGFRKRYNTLPNWQRWLLEGLVLIALFSALSSWASRHMLSDDDMAPPMQLTTLDGQPVFIDWSNQQQRTLLYFFAPWCGVCRISMPGLNLIDTNNLQVHAVALDYQDSQAVSDFINDVGFTGSVLMGNRQTQDQFKIQGYPSYYVVDSQGQVQHRDQGLSTPPGLWLRTRQF